MKTVVITDPLFIPGEETVYEALFDAGIFRLHLRKPGSAREELAALIERIPPAFRSRISLNDHFDLAERYGLGGVHLNGRNPVPPQNYRCLISRSCHSMEEIRTFRSRCGYLFLSPIFDSISKQGYSSHFTESDLLAAAKNGDLDEKVFALGGVVPGRAAYLSSLGFGGGALLGYIWEPYKRSGSLAAIRPQLDALAGMSAL